MPSLQQETSSQTHTVTNQPPPLVEYNLYRQDAALQSVVKREGAGWAAERLDRFGEAVGDEPLTWGELANKYPPQLRTHDRFGHRIDDVDFHPAWHSLLRLGIENELHSLPWATDRPGAQVARAALFSLLGQADAGVMCPISMTYSAVPALAGAAELEAEWRPRLVLADYDEGALCGMALTEKQGGSDVGANTTVATEIGSGEYELTGHKWFCSHPVCDAFLVVARTPDSPPGSRGLSCFLLPRFLPDGSKNQMLIMRLKDKLGTRSLASGEVELDRAWARLVGEEGDGLPVIMEMVNHTRLDCSIGSAAGMRRAAAEATHHAAYRSAFGKALIDQPLMQNVLADLCIEAEAAIVVALRLARAFENPEEVSFKRLATPVVKYWLCKLAPAVVVEALECLGGNGYVEESAMSRLYRDSQVNSTWEGSGNVIALDVLRALVKAPDSLEAFFSEVELVKGANPTLDQAIDRAKSELSKALDSDPQFIARRLVEELAKVLQGSLLARAVQDDPGVQPVADAFCASRFNGQSRMFGTLPPGLDCVGIVERNRPKVL